MRFTPLDELKVRRGVSVGKRGELEMAAELIDRFSGSFDIDKYRDEYREVTIEVIRAKRKGGQMRVEDAGARAQANGA